MRSEDEMRELVVAKVTAHRRRRRRAQVALGGAGTAVAVVLALIVAGPSGRDDDGVRAGPGEVEDVVTTTTEAPSTTEGTTTSIPTTNVPATTPTETSTSSTTSTTTTTTATVPTGPEPIVVEGADGDLEATITFTADPARPGEVVVRVQAADPTGLGQRAGEPWGLWALIDVGRYGDEGHDGVSMGDVPANCAGFEPVQELTPDTLDEQGTLTHSPGTFTTYIVVTSGVCSDAEDRIILEAQVTFP